MDAEAKTRTPEWLLSRDGKRFGPMNSVQLRKLCSDGKIQPADLISQAGVDRWIPVTCPPKRHHSQRENLGGNVSVSPIVDAEGHCLFCPSIG